jgi:[NiFe] hydrogenase assembly HybE family chaperone
MSEDLAEKIDEPKYVPIPLKFIKEREHVLEKVFSMIHIERMSDVPILNEKIEVKAIGFQQWQDSIMGVLVTPWFMSIVLLPNANEKWDSLQETSSKTYFFPSGKYKFIAAFEPEIGKYQSCSLFSPMFEFSDNDTAIETAKYVVKELMNIENIEESDINSKQIERIWSGEEEHPDRVAEKEEVLAKLVKENNERKTISEKLEEPLSRRDLLRGAFLKNEERH